MYEGNTRKNCIIRTYDKYKNKLSNPITAPSAPARKMSPLPKISLSENFLPVTDNKKRNPDADTQPSNEFKISYLLKTMPAIIMIKACTSDTLRSKTSVNDITKNMETINITDIASTTETLLMKANKKINNPKISTIGYLMLITLLQK